MRVLVRTKRINDCLDDIEVVNAKTGEPIEGVTSLSFFWGLVGQILTLRMADFDIDIDHEVQILSRKDLVACGNNTLGCEGADYS